MGREVGGGFRMGNTCKFMADSCQCMAKNCSTPGLPVPSYFLEFAQVHREGNGNPLQYSYLENPMDREAW